MGTLLSSCSRGDPRRSRHFKSTRPRPRPATPSTKMMPNEVSQGLLARSACLPVPACLPACLPPSFLPTHSRASPWPQPAVARECGSRRRDNEPRSFLILSWKSFNFVRCGSFPPLWVFSRLARFLHTRHFKYTRLRRRRRTSADDGERARSRARCQLHLVCTMKIPGVRLRPRPRPPPPRPSISPYTVLLLLSSSSSSSSTFIGLSVGAAVFALIFSVQSTWPAAAVSLVCSGPSVHHTTQDVVTKTTSPPEDS